MPAERPFWMHCKAQDNGAEPRVTLVFTHCTSHRKSCIRTSHTYTHTHTEGHTRPRPSAAFFQVSANATFNAARSQPSDKRKCHPRKKCTGKQSPSPAERANVTISKCDYASKTSVLIRSHVSDEPSRLLETRKL